MAPAVEIPVVAVVDEPLRRDDALGSLIALAPVVDEVQLVPLQRGARQRLKPLTGGAVSHPEHANPSAGFRKAEGRPPDGARHVVAAHAPGPV